MSLIFFKHATLDFIRSHLKLIVHKYLKLLRIMIVMPHIDYSIIKLKIKKYITF